MRISDWSSDVCSSDLKGVDAAVAEQVDAHLPGLETRRDEQRVHHVLKQRLGLGIAQDRLRHRGAHRQDRKSVVSGKSVSVRVALGGRRIITKKYTYIDLHT